MASSQGEIGGKDILLKVAGAAVTVTGAEVTDIFTKTAHGLAINDVIEFTSLTGGAGISINTLYYVTTVPSADTFTISATKGGVTVNITTALTASSALFYLNVGGIRSKSFAINTEAIDITNQDSGEWKEMLDLAGIRSVSVSGSGVFENGTAIRAVQSDMLSNTMRKALLVMGSAYDIFKGTYKFTSLEYSGDYNGESQYSISLESSGEVTFVAAA